MSGYIVLCVGKSGLLSVHDSVVYVCVGVCRVTVCFVAIMCVCGGVGLCMRWSCVDCICGELVVVVYVDEGCGLGGVRREVEVVVWRWLFVLCNHNCEWLCA